MSENTEEHKTEDEDTTKDRVQKFLSELRPYAAQESGIIQRAANNPTLNPYDLVNRIDWFIVDLKNNLAPVLREMSSPQAREVRELVDSVLDPLELMAHRHNCHLVDVCPRFPELEDIFIRLEQVETGWGAQPPNNP